MSEAKSSDTSLLTTYQDMFLAHQKLFPYTNFAKRYAQAARFVMEAQVGYAQALLRGQAILLGAETGQPKSGAEIGPCEAAKQPEYMTE
ncbi:MAG: hypothetical protein B7Z75_03655 [Acidocella sp. 20-57-95]|nr:MAG: hypothetical protein B7Z75_03655 [Acidocella sp. 20-57-95]OYV60065.1 MAG: hypothetical protein B7Z71_06860 [Acidocella sp. 21-58-7]HQT63978.1 hypothetical protein [Acidocella sp.]HQU04262.1 hypothetical protein [Acidocella sp.]